MKGREESRVVNEDHASRCRSNEAGKIVPAIDLPRCGDLVEGSISFLVHGEKNGAAVEAKAGNGLNGVIGTGPDKGDEAGQVAVGQSCGREPHARGTSDDLFHREEGTVERVVRMDVEGCVGHAVLR